MPFRRFRHQALVRAVLLSAAVAVVGFAGPASAAVDSADLRTTAARQPDGRIRLQKITYEHFPTETYSRPWTGNNIYNTTATGQRVRVMWFDTTPGSQRWIFGLSVQNDGTSSDRVKVKATGAALSGWTVKYFRGQTNVTAAVVAGTFMTPSLGPGASYLIEARITRASEGFQSGDLVRLVKLTSVGNSSRMDTVKLVVALQTCGC